MADVEIISSSSCPFAQRTRMALMEKGIDFELTEISLDAKPGWFLEISPYGKVPVIRHNGTVIYESAVINEYLEEVFPALPLLPADPARRAQARIWIDFANVRFTPHVYKLMLAQDEEGQNFQKRKLAEALYAMEFEGLHLLSDGPYWMGEDLTLVDLTFLPHLQRFVALRHYRDFDVPEDHTRLRDWLALMETRPSVQAMRWPDETYIKNWSKYAFDTSTGTTARDMRES
jgi:glutathione S-transferase